MRASGMAPFADSDHVTVDGLRVAFRRAGSGSPVLLIHGVPTSSRLWDLVGTDLVRDHDVVAIDMVGFGESDKPLDRDVSVAAQAELVPSILDALGIDSPTVVGHDTGGAVAQILAVRSPERVAALVLIDSVCFDSWPIPQMKALALGAPLLARLSPGSTMDVLERLLARDVPEGEARDALAAGLRRWGQGPDELRAFLANVRALDSRHTLAVARSLGELELPAHVVWGAADPYQSPEWAPRLRDAIPGATLRMVDGGHFLPWERPDEVAAEIRALLERAGS
jgi:2-hydroxymuconate-semialdehyde hydrolase